MDHVDERPASYLDLVRRVDAFSYRLQEPERFAAFVKTYYEFKVQGWTSVFGLIPQAAIDAIDWPDFWTVDHDSRCLTLAQGIGTEQRTAWFAKTIQAAHSSGKVPKLKTLCGELLPMYDTDGHLVLNIDRAASCLFGTVAHGVQMIAYTMTDEGTKHFWVARRSTTRKSYPGMLDNCVGGGLVTGESPLECLAREASEEASLPAEYVRKHARSFGTLSYHMDRDGNGNDGHQPQVQYAYELEVPPDIVPIPADEENEKFEKMTLKEVQAAMKVWKFKANCAVTWIGWMVKEGIISSENEERLHELCPRIHRELDFPAV